MAFKVCGNSAMQRRKTFDEAFQPKRANINQATWNEFFKTQREDEEESNYDKQPD